MRQTSLCVVGLLAALVVGITLGGSQQLPPVQAQGRGEQSRFQVSAFGYGYGYMANNERHGHGAYVIDTATGEVYLTEDGGRLKSIGKPK